MAIAFDAVGGVGIADVATSMSWSHTCGAGSDRLLLVAVSIDTGTNIITSVLIDGTTDIVAQKAKDLAYGGTITVAMYYLLNPGVGAHTIAVTVSAARSCIGLSASYTGVQQTGFPDASNSVGQTSTTLTIATTIATANAWVAMFSFAYGAAADVVAGTGTTMRQIATHSTLAYVRVGLGDSGGPQAAGSYSMTMTSAGLSGLFPGVTVAFAPSAGSSAVRVPPGLVLSQALPRASRW